MSALQAFLRGPRIARVLESLGIDARRYWLLVDLFGQLCERGEMLDQLGQNGVALKMMAWLYGGISTLVAVMLIATGASLRIYISTFLVLTAFLLLASLLSETGNSLVNPVEGLVLAHQPIGGSTYTAAKLTHLVRIVLYLVPAVNLAPALGGLLLKGTAWWYPPAHLAAGFLLGMLSALLCCAAFGWLMRLVPARRLKAAGQFAGAIPFLGMMYLQSFQNWIRHASFSDWLPAQPAARWGMALTFALGAAAIVLLGIRSLSADYLIHVSGMMHGAAAPRKSRRWRIGESAAGLGGPAGRAGFAYVARMMRRDWQFRRQLIPMLACVLMMLAPLAARGWEIDPFSGRFSPMHLFPHACGMLLFFVCTLLPFGSDHKGAWVFLSAPAQALGGFARGIHALLWIEIVVAPHLLLFALLAWFWGVGHAALFVSYSVSVASLVLALELRLVNSVPFTRPFDNSRGASLLPLMFLGGLTMAVVVGLQHYFVFRSAAIVAGATLIAGAAAWWLTRNSLAAMEASMRYHLGLLTAEAGDFYKEVL